ncbi:hypothetical protein LTS18_007573 [Coniosporium uncinatum]|uniref:Uncharacterized protein n=1 Tax=Coniosporium uncinatum TaxID=93489 RepID=A0ACC3D2F0_9PEZI|nr:hypothetical protein LTS18_007573 [Coniosporium uncinatum]
MTLNCVDPDTGAESSVASMNSIKNGPLPWRPRAVVHATGYENIQDVTHPMEAPNFADWSVYVHGLKFFWTISDIPHVSLTLIEADSASICARFTYSEFGTQATKGNGVGTFVMYGGHYCTEKATVELAIASCAIAINHWKDMGRNYKNTGGLDGESLRTMSATSERAMTLLRRHSV